jgi:hypothetical protein
MRKDTVTLRNPEDGDDSSPKHRFEIVLHGTKSQKTYFNVTAVKACQKTVFSNFKNTTTITTTTTTTTTATTTISTTTNYNNNRILYYLCAESTATAPITDRPRFNYR